MDKSLLPHQQEINQWLQRLDDVSRGFEARWGYGRLERLCSPALAVKWDSQWQRMNAAIQAQHLADVATLAQGCMRGWAAVEADALALGHKPLDPDAWETRMPLTGEVLRVVKTIADSHAPVPQGTVVMTLAEVAGIVQAQRKRVYQEPPPPPGCDKPDPSLPAEFWKSGGDKIEF